MGLQVSELVRKSKAIQPTSVMLPSKQPKPGETTTFAESIRADPQTRSADPGLVYTRFLEHLLDHPSPMMRRLGYTRNPATCIHHRKRYITSRTCMDCGMSL